MHIPDQRIWAAWRCMALLAFFAPWQPVQAEAQVQVRSGYALSAETCGGFPKLPITMQPGFCAGLVAAKDDGLIFPRTLVQAGALDVMLREMGKPLDAVVLLEVDYGELTKRIGGQRAHRHDSVGGRVIDHCAVGAHRHWREAQRVHEEPDGWVVLADHDGDQAQMHRASIREGVTRRRPPASAQPSRESPRPCVPAQFRPATAPLESRGCWPPLRQARPSACWRPPLSFSHAWECRELPRSWGY